MYSFKEKQKHYTELRNPDAAEQDLELLRKKQPELQALDMYARNPIRYADDILYALLDISERDEIRNNRRGIEKKQLPKIEKKKANQAPKPKVEKCKTTSKQKVKELKTDSKLKVEKSKSMKSIPPSTGTISPIQESKPQPSSITTES
ncbi:hypothetical protein [Bacteroides hominis]|uniref:hypothetical protein n=1 Tax=Bacteroides hominis TaxID=2763023 RepID=UPI00164C1C52|nr:hypothetical protein [Bacteroides hominis (ex Liu et al. 2022)]MBC5612858.1 hypothetical protein [Bacteroides hominis (ex Liu et al. 2022)]